MPTLSRFAPSITFNENTVNARPQLLDLDVLFTDVEGDFNGGRLTLSGLLAEDRVSVNNQGSAVSQIGLSGTNITFGGVVIGTLAGGAGATLTITFNASATSAAIDFLIQNLTYANVSDTPTASRDLLLNITDAAGNDLGASGSPSFAERTGVANPFNGRDVGSDSLPTFADLDGDGDFDVVVGENDGNLNYFRNTGTATAPVFVQQTGADNPFNGVDTGFLSSSTFADLDGDGDLDALVAGTSGTLRYFRNTGTATAPVFIQQTGGNNPFIGVDPGLDGNPTLADLDGDGDLDAVIGNYNGQLRYFRNTGTATAPVFVQQTGTANPFNGVDVGSTSSPDFADLDGDGDFDVVVGENDGTLNYFRNTGTATAPVFVQQTGADNPFNGVDVGFESNPTLADLDGDGDLDAVVGESDGVLNYFQNTTTRGQTITVTVIAQSEGPTEADDILTGDEADNVIDALGGNDTVNGLGGNDTLSGGAGSDTLNGGTGTDTVDYSTAAGGVTASLTTGLATSDGDGGTDNFSFIENLTGSAFGDSLTGSGGNNALVGGAGNDSLTGAGGDDVLRGGAGVDVLSGGAGIDTVDYSTAAAGVRAQLNSNASTNDGDGGSDTFSGIENLTGSAFNDLLIGDAVANVLRGGTGTDTLLGLAGNDVLWGGAGALNTLQGGLGDDTYVLEAADSIVENVGEGTDTVDARINTYVLANNVENLLFGGSGNFAGTGNGLANVITGGVGSDTLRGGGGVDVLNGGLGSDTADYTLAAARVVARIDQQRATNDGDGATDTYTGIENLIGSNFNDVLIGDGNANILMGGVGADTLLGFGGDDILMGGSGGGNNELQGGTGNDRYILDAFDTCVELVGEGIDTVEARIGSYTMGANIENLIFTGVIGSFVGTGNVLDNTITGGAANDILRGGGGNDTINGGGGSADEVQLRGVAANYTITQVGATWRIVDSVAGRDGTTTVASVEVLRFSDNTTRLLTYPAPGALEPVDKVAGEDFGSPLVSLLPDEPLPEVQILADDDFILSGKVDGPEVLPAVFDDGLPLRLSESGQFDVGRPMDAFGHPLVVDAPWGVQMRAEWTVGVEPLQLSENATQTLTYGPSGDLEPVEKAVGEDFGGPLVSSLMDYPEILPGLDDIFLTLAKDGDLPLVLPGVEDPFADLFGGLERLSLDRGSDSPWRMLSLDQASTPGDISGGITGTRDHSGWNHDAWLV